MQRRNVRTWAVISVGLILFGLIANFERQNVLDWVKLRNYHPPSSVSQIASKDTMTAYARRIFYVNHPAIDDKVSFSKACPNNGGEKTVVIGCYHPIQQGIFVLSVSDPRLQGVEQVTAAHEMLHAAYDRLSAKEKNYVDGLLMNYYKNDLKDKRLLDTIAAYKQSEPNDVVNEMHSVFGTEVMNLPAPLETYYKRYFTDRQKVAGYAANYQQAFTERVNEVKQDDATLDSWQKIITSDKSNLNSQLQTLNNNQAKLNSLKASRDFTDYNALVPTYNAEVDSYNSLVTSTRSLISQYNVLVQKRNAIALEENQLTQEITAEPTQVKN